MQRFFVLTIILSFSYLVSCSGTENVSQDQSEKKNAVTDEYPSWYGSKSIEDSDTVITGYATAISGDSASSISKAESWAQLELKSAVSDKLEDIRSDAAVEYGSEYELDSSRFLIALRKVDNAVSNLAETQNVEVKTVEGYESYRSFVEVSVPKEELVNRIGKRLGGYEKAWNAMKESKAFGSF